MTLKETQSEGPAELRAIGAIYAALKDLDPKAQIRALRYSAEMLGIPFIISSKDDNTRISTNSERIDDAAPTETVLPQSSTDEIDDADGISAVALKWIKRSGLDPKSLQALFSLGIDEIDLVAKSVPGSSKRERMRHVILLKGIAAYLGTGVARITHEQLKEAALHYNAYDVSNFAKYLREFSADVGGTKEAGFTLTARGLNSGTELVKEMLGQK